MFKASWRQMGLIRLFYREALLLDIIQRRRHIDRVPDHDCVSQQGQTIRLIFQPFCMPLS